MTDLAERYGTTSRNQRWVVAAVGGAIGLVVLAFVLWSFLDEADPEVRSQLIRYEISGQHQASADLTVVRSSDEVAATCRVEALAADHSVVGETVQTVSSGPATRTLRVDVRTEREAVSVVSRGCTAPGQSRPR